MSDDDYIPFGKYSSPPTKMKDVPASYLLWLWNNGMWRDTRSQAMRFIPFDIGTYLVHSGSRPAVWHVVSLIPDEYYGCSCEAYDYAYTCRHIREAERRRRMGRLMMVVAARVITKRYMERWIV